jgi:hexosaminidase
MTEVVEYAARKGINVIPEIEMPGHSTAALAAYPELGCKDKHVKVACTWGVFEDIFCPTETSFDFLEKVLEEIIEIFPSEYIHIGGDEAPKKQWEESAFCSQLIKQQGLKDVHELQSYFIKRIETFLNSKGRSIIGWDEILEGGLAPNATVMSWRGTKGGIDAANAGHNVIMTPTSHCYFDYYQANSDNEPLAIGGLLPLDKVYNYNPVPQELPPDKHKYILGAQGNVWTEYMPSFEQVEYMALTRMTALSEVLWRDPSDKNYKIFLNSLKSHIDYWESQGVNIYNPSLNLDLTAQVTKNGIFVSDINQQDQKNDFEYFEPESQTWRLKKKWPFELKESGIYKFRAVDGEKRGKVVDLEFELHKGQAGQLRLSFEPDAQYQGQGASSLMNGLKGSQDKFGDGEWIGFKGTNLYAEFYFKDPIEINDLRINFFKGEAHWIYLPENLEVWIYEPGEIKQLLMRTDSFDVQGNVASVYLKSPPHGKFETRYLRVIAENHGIIEDGKPGAGNKAWLFVDEIIIN